MTSRSFDRAQAEYDRAQPPSLSIDDEKRIDKAKRDAALMFDGCSNDAVDFVLDDLGDAEIRAIVAGFVVASPTSGYFAAILARGAARDLREKFRERYIERAGELAVKP